MTISRDRLCHLSAALFSLCVVVPVAFIVGDRSVPFEFGHAYFKPAEMTPGTEVLLSITTVKVTKNCDGEVKQMMIDADGTVYDLGWTAALYQYAGGENRTVYRNKVIPRTKPDGSAPFASGPAVYRSEARFWCNPFQQLWPIKGLKPLEVPFTVVPN